MNTMPRISVAMATYNGEKYIEEQLLSICRQTRKPDEIVISDDGSRDGTLEVVKRVATSEDAKGIDFVVISDNPRHGYGGNFEWAIKHTTGDLIFLSDQDDVWLPEKVEEIWSVFDRHSDAMCVIHGATLINQYGERIPGEFHRLIKLDQLPTNDDCEVQLPQHEYLERAASAALANGMVMCLSRKLLDTALPFPESSGLHDCWIGFCAMVHDHCWYLNKPLAEYRLHGTNTCGNSAQKAGITQRGKRAFRKISNCQSAVLERYQLGKEMVRVLDSAGLNNHVAYGTAKRVCDIGKIQAEAFCTGGIVGAYQLSRLFLTDMRYRRSGTSDFLYQLAAVMFRKKDQLPKEDFL